MRLLPTDHPLVKGKTIGNLILVIEQDQLYAYDNLITYRIMGYLRGELCLVVEGFRHKMRPLPTLIAGSKIASQRTCTYHNRDNTCYLRKSRCTQPACYRDASCEGMRAPDHS